MVQRALVDGGTRLLSWKQIFLMSLAQKSDEWKAFIAREPQMCIENEQGATVLSV